MTSQQSQIITSLKDINYNNPISLFSKPKVNSPRSVDTLGRLGYELEDLIYIDFNTYKNKHECYGISESIMKSRYEFYDSHRKEKVEECLKVSLLTIIIFNIKSLNR